MTHKKPFSLEFPIRTSSKILYDYLSKPHNLSQWFADNVEVDDNIYLFTWDNSITKAKLINKKNNMFIRFRWEESNENEYFEFKIQKNDVTGDTALIITDFAKDSQEKKELTLLWDSQITKLTKKIGG